MKATGRTLQIKPAGPDLGYWDEGWNREAINQSQLKSFTWGVERIYGVDYYSVGRKIFTRTILLATFRSRFMLLLAPSPGTHSVSK
jgi:hypothetical protein